MGWWRDKAECRRVLEAHGWNAAAAAAAMGCHRSTVTTWMKRHGFKAGKQGPRPAVDPAGMDEREGVVAAELGPSDRADHAKLIALAGFEQDQAEVAQVTVNRWDAPAEGGGTVAMAQVKGIIRKKVQADDLLPARTRGYKPRKPRTPRPTRRMRYTYVTSDLHAPYHDERKHKAQCMLLAALAPDDAIDLGDMLDLPRPSRHRATPGWDASPQECIDVAYRVWCDRIAASPEARWRALLGNHDIRAEVAIREKLADLAGLTRAKGELPVMDLGYLLRFDELGVELIRPEGEYHAARAQIAPGLIAQHGTRTARKGSTGAAAAGEGLACSILQGHDHRQGITYTTRIDEHGRPVQLVNVSVGCSCRIEGGIGYAPDPSWTNGDAVVVHDADGGWHVELVVWDGDALRWRDYVMRPG